MLATKNRAAKSVALLLVVVAALAGCSPPGTRALYRGKRLLENGNYEAAAAELKTAKTILYTNAIVWSYYGLACHKAGQISNAVTAYQRAMNLDHDLLEVRFNLGCLWLEQNNIEAAKLEFIAYTLRRGNDPEGWIKLGTAQLRAREATTADKSFREALRLDTNNVVALNGQALAQLQLNRPREAVQLLQQILQHQPEYGPALLNLASISHQYLNDRAEALRCYRAYLELKPRPEDWEAVNAIVQSLDPQHPRAVVTNAPVAMAVAPPRPSAAASNHPAVPTHTETTTTASKSSPAASLVEPARETVRLPPEPVIKPAVSTTASRTSSPPSVVAADVSGKPGEVVIVGEPKPPAKRGFFSRVFSRRDGRPNSAVPAANAVVLPPTVTSGGTRYTYLSPTTPVPGDRPSAEREFNLGRKAQQASRLDEAIQFFRRASQLDPGYFEAAYSLGLVAFDARNYKAALTAWENTLAIKPDSVDARYNFALTLKAANYPTDAASELEKLLAAHPNETRAHLTLGNLYAEQLSNPSRARAHYSSVLQLDPRNPQAQAIRYWLAANPP